VTDWHPRHRRSRKLPLLARIGTAVVVPALGATALVAVLDKDDPTPSADVLHAQVETPDEAGQTSDAAKASADSNAPALEPSATDPATGGGAANAAEAGSGRPADETDQNLPADNAGSDETGAATPSRPSSPPADEATPSEPRPGDEPDRPETPDAPETPPGTPPPPLVPPERPAPSPGPAPAPSLNSYEAALIDAANSARNRAGCPDLQVDSRLTDAARRHSVDMRERHFFSHVNPDGQSPSDRAEDAGYRGSVSESLSYGLRSASLVIATWSLSPSDRSTLLDCDYTDAGVGVELGRLGAWWTLNVGRD
jgi:uncharacterized protein YkwD